MVNYKWITDPCDCIIAEDKMTKIIQTIHWRLIGTDENNTSSELYGAQSFPKPSEEGFIPFEELNQEIVLGWLGSVLDIPAMEKQIEEAIYLIDNPIMVQLNLLNN